MSKRIVIALGGNALGNTLPEQAEAVKITARTIVDLIEDGNQVVVAHGNGPHGHIAVGTADIDSAVEYLKKRGVAFAEETAVVKDGRLAAIYLSDEIAGFAVHLVRA